MRNAPTLSKSRYMAGHQCHKRLFLECFHKDLSEPVGSSTQARFDEGQLVGELARQLRPGGVLIEEDYRHPREAIEATAKALSDPNVPAIYEAAFQHEDVLIRVDILARTSPESFELMEVKSSTKVKPEHKPDLGIQLWVLQGIGLSVEKACVVHLNNSFEYAGGDYVCDQLFTVADLTDKTRASVDKYSEALKSMRDTLLQSDPPEIGVGSHCNKPHACNFLSHCRAVLPEHTVHDLYRLTSRLRNDFAKLGIDSIPEIPKESVNLSDIQKRMVECVKVGEPFLSATLATRLRSWGYPLHFLDFETIGPALPIYQGTNPYEVIPFQWSLHTLHQDGSLEHREYLHDSADDPRTQLTEALLRAVGTEGRIVHYSAYEATVIENLKNSVLKFAEQLDVLKGRLVDLAPEIREHYYHPVMNGSFSLKAVYPALFPGEGYDELEISEGTMASNAFLEMIQPNTTEGRQTSLRDDLLAYCRFDTEATVRIYQRLAGETQ